MANIKLTITVPNLDEVLKHYNQIQVFRSNAIDGTYTEITSVTTRLRLSSGCALYTFTDDTGTPSHWYRTCFYNTVNGSASNPSDPTKGVAFDLNAQILSVAQLKDIYLFGVDCTRDDGTPFPDIMFEWGIAFAIDWLEKELDIKIRPTSLDERYDYYRRDYQEWVSIRTRQSPVISVSAVDCYWPSDNLILSFDPSWIRLRPDDGQIHIIPATGTIAQMFLRAGGSFLPILAQDWVPDLFRVQYTAGFAAGQLPMSIRELIGKKAAFGPLNVAGDLITGAGIASQSVSLDGISQSISTTSSATNAGYGARLIQYRNEIRDQLPTLKRYYKGSRLAVA